MVKHVILLFVFTISSLSSILCSMHGDREQIRKFVYNNNGLGVYSFEYETSDGAFRREEGGLRPGSDELVVRGEFGYVDPRGRYYTVKYVADANGYQPQADADTRYNDRRIV